MRKNYFYTCCSVIGGKTVGETYFIASREEAYKLYVEKHGVEPEFFDGPFYRKFEKNKKEIKKTNIQLSNKIIRGNYKGSQVKAVVLNDPKDYVYIIFLDKSSDIKQTNIVHISEIKE